MVGGALAVTVSILKTTHGGVDVPRMKSCEAAAAERDAIVESYELREHVCDEDDEVGCGRGLV